MRRYTDAAAILGAVIAVIAIFTGFQFFPDEETILTELLNERTQILQDAYFERIPKDVAKALLPEIEASPLLTEDERELMNNTAGEMDIINNMYLMDYELTDKGEDEATYRVEVLWDLQGITENYYQKCTYSIRTVRSDGKMKLCEMTLIAS